MKNSIHFFNEGITFRFPKKNLVKKWINQVIQSENRLTGNINIIFCSDEYLLQLNEKYLNHDTLTDIITFDFSEENIISGDLFISLPRVIENSKLFSKPFNEEIHRVIIHGILHLCGYQDKNEQEQKIMSVKENLYLEQRPNELIA